MALPFLENLDYNEIENEQRSVILIYIIKRIFPPGKKTRNLSDRGSFKYTFNRRRLG